MHRIALVAASLSWLLAPAAAQCGTQWLPGAGLTGINGHVHCSVGWDPDGPGPESTRVVYGGTFYIAGDRLVNNIAIFDPATSTWSTFGSGMNGGVLELAVTANNDLIAAGQFTVVDGVAANRIARWNGTAWAPLGGGLAHDVTALTLLANGDIAAGTVNGINVWNGTTWSALGPSGGLVVACLAQLPNGNLVAGGNFNSIGGVPARDVAQWNGTTWAQIGSGIPGNDLLSTLPAEVLSMCVTTSGDLVVAGTWYSASGTRFLARWDGAAWSPQDNGLASSSQLPFALHETANGDLLASGSLQFAAGGAARLARWSGGSWSPVGPIAPNASGGVVTTVTLLGADVYAGGTFEEMAGFRVQRAAHWDGVAWSALTLGTSDAIRVLAAAPGGDVIAAGQFDTIAGTAAKNVARWNGSSWIAMDAPSGSQISQALVLRNGDVLIAGSLPALGAKVARWNGTAWVPYGANWPANVGCLLELSNGSVAAGGSNGSAPYYQSAATIWDGSTGTVIPNIPGFPGQVRALAELPNGNLLMATNSTLVQWDGVALQFFASAASAIITITPQISWMKTSPSGRLFVGGMFTAIQGVPANNIATWNGSAWSPLGTGATGLSTGLLLPNEDLLALVSTAGGAPINGLARWDGANWSAFGGGDLGLAATIALPPGGPLFVGGYFQLVDGQVSPYIARLDTTCPASAAKFGAGCTSSGGSNTLTADAPPWVEATFHATGTGLPTNALVLALTSITSIPQGAVPLASIFVEGVPGCDVLVAPDILGALVTTTGTATSSFFLPDSPPIVGVTFYHQLVPFDLGSGAITATNALQLTAGQF